MRLLTLLLVLFALALSAPAFAQVASDDYRYHSAFSKHRFSIAGTAGLLMHADRSNEAPRQLGHAHEVAIGFEVGYGIAGAASTGSTIGLAAGTRYGLDNQLFGHFLEARFSYFPH